MKRQINVAILLTVLITTATIMAGVNPEPPDAASDINASVVDGPVTIRGNAYDTPYSHVWTVYASDWTVTTIPAKYNIGHSVNVKGEISGARYWALVRITTTVAASGGNLTSPRDSNTATISPIFGFSRKINVSDDHISRWQTTSKGNFTFTSTATGECKYSQGKLKLWSVEGSDPFGVSSESWTNGTDSTTIDVQGLSSSVSSYSAY